MWCVGSILLLSLATAWGAEICCSYGGCFDENAPFTGFPLPDCPSTIGAIFNLFTRNNRNSPQSLTRNSIPGQFSGSRMTYFLVHGYTGSHNSVWAAQMKDALLDREDANVVIVGWEKGAAELNYPKSASNTRSVGVDLGLVMTNIKNNGGSAASRIHCIGHSLGSHLCGHAGRASAIGRISGMDPAGPSFDNKPLTAGLSTNAATFVDVIHSHGKGGPLIYGTLRVIGHMDFYPNGADIQPGCSERVALGKAGRQHFYGWTSEDDEEPGKLGDLGCSHGRAHDYYIESVKSDCFAARQSCTNNNNIPGSCSNCGNVCARMGFAARGSGSNGLYYLTTTASAPYCQN